MSRLQYSIRRNTVRANVPFKSGLREKPFVGHLSPGNAEDPTTQVFCPCFIGAVAGTMSARHTQAQFAAIGSLSEHSREQFVFDVSIEDVSIYRERVLTTEADFQKARTRQCAITATSPQLWTAAPAVCERQAWLRRISRPRGLGTARGGRPSPGAL